MRERSKKRNADTVVIVLICVFLTCSCGYFSLSGKLSSNEPDARVALEKVFFNKKSALAIRHLQISKGPQQEISLKLIVNTRRTGNKTSGRLRIIEFIPKSFASSVDDLKFSITPTKVINRDPVIAWDICELADGEPFELTDELDPCNKIIEIESKTEHLWLRRIRNKHGGTFPSMDVVKKELKAIHNEYVADAKKEMKDFYYLHPNIQKTELEYGAALGEYFESQLADTDIGERRKPEPVPSETAVAAPDRLEAETPPIETPKVSRATNKEILNGWLRNNPGWRVAALSDYDRELLKSGRESLGKNHIPYFATGDFNKDTHNDFAAIIVRKTGNRFGLVVFNGPFKTGQDISPALFSEGLQKGDALFVKERLLIGPYQSSNILILTPKGGTYELKSPDYDY